MKTGLDDEFRPPMFIGEPGRAARRLAERAATARALEIKRSAADGRI